VDGFVSRADAAASANVTITVIKNWQFKGWLDKDGVRRKLRAHGTMVCLEDVDAAERDTRRKPARSHRRLKAPRLEASSAA
jgi:hypothetical protein